MKREQKLTIMSYHIVFIAL